MSRNACFKIFIVALISILSSFVIGFVPVTSHISSIFAQMQNMYIAISAVIIALLLKKQKHYWLIMLGVAVIVAIVIQLFIVESSVLSLALLYKICAFIVYVYLIKLIQFMW